ncbi:MAG TPA: hypothetical protein VGH23_16115 [Rhizomicrobium sp.]|jgi:hypothetical protein
MAESAGAQWCARFPTSASLGDLAEPFQGNAKAFIDALRDAGASVSINATYRPPERAYLMHFCCLVAGYRDEGKVFHQIAPGDVPAMQGVDIDWTCGGDPGGARAAAVAMRQGYEIAYPAALVSNHTRRLAIDMTIQFTGAISVKTGHGSLAAAACQSDLWPVGKSYGVIKLPSDAPHWSVDGH